MKNLLSSKWRSVLIFVFLEIITIGMGMGVPFLTILLGFIVGWFLPPFLQLPEEPSSESLRRIISSSALASLVSFGLLGLIWLPALSWLFDPGKDLAEFGMPLLLFEPRASFIGWIVLMVLVSPGLQFLMTVFGSIGYLAKKRD